MRKKKTEKIKTKFLAFLFIGEDTIGVPVLAVVSVDQCIAENALAHRTSRFELSNRQDGTERLIVRRGDPFYVKLLLSREYDPNTDGISVVFTLDGVEKPQIGHGTLVATPVLTPGDDADVSWRAVIDASIGNTLRIKVSIAV